MVSMKEIRAANGSVSSLSPKAVFAGATSGIGLGAIEALLKNTNSPTLYIIGRSGTKFAPTLSRLRSLNPSAQLNFIEAQVSSLKEVDRVCQIIASTEYTLDVLWLSQGGLDSSGHELTPEGLFSDYAVSYYGRTLFVHRLLPLLDRSTDGRVISVLSAGSEGPVDSSDFGMLDPKNYGFWKALKQGVTMTSLTMRQLSLLNPRVSFLHTNPGMVSTDVHDKWADTMTGIFGGPMKLLFKWVLIPLAHSFGYTPEEAGQTGFYEVSSARFGHDSGKNFYRISQDGEELGSGSSGQDLLTKYEDDKTQEKLLEHTLGVFKQVVTQ